MAPGLWALAGAAALAYLLLGAGRAESWPRSAVKTVATAALAAIALIPGPSLLALGLVLCVAGDFALSRPGPRAFLSGVAAFAAGHIALTAAFLTHPAADPARLAAAPRLALLTALALTGLAIARMVLRRAKAPLRPALLAYIPVILSMTIAAATLPASGPTAPILPGAVLFAASDTLLACALLLPRVPRALPRAVWATYWPAIALFALAA